jgi:hypothetical protein
VLWECYSCHIGYKHGPRWSNKKGKSDVKRLEILH